MYDGVKAMIAAEKELASNSAAGIVQDTVCGPHLKKPSDIVGFPAFPAGQQGSLLYKFLTRDVWDQLKDEKDKFGYPFREAILSGCQNTDSGIGVYAGSPDSYDKFAPLFTPLLENYHKFKLSTGHKSDMDASHLKCPPFAPEDAKMIRSTRIRVGRNLADFPLGPGISKD